MNRGLRKNGKNDFEKDFFNLMNNAVFGETMESVRKHRDIKLVTTKTRRNYLVSEPNFHTTIFFFFPENLLAAEMKRTHILMNKTLYLGLSISEISKIIICKFWCDYVKPKYGEKTKLCYLDTESFIVYINICKRCWNKIWYSKLWIRQTIT